MTHRRPHSGPLTDRLRRIVRQPLETVGLLGPAVETGDHAQRTAGGEFVPGPRRRATGRSTSHDVTDPATGPTSRGEILEYGLSPAQYVRTVVTEHGGRIKQRQFADEYGWSSSTISRLLSDLEERGVIARYRVGHEKIVQLTDAERVARNANESRKTRRRRSIELG